MNSNLDQEQDAIVRVASHPRRDWGLAVARVNPAGHEAVRHSLLHPPVDPAATLGRLDVLPTEILTEICLELDIASLFSFRHVNKRASQVVHGLPSYQLLIEHALDAWCVVLRTGLALYYTLPYLTAALLTENCRLCGSFGGYVFVPALIRCCQTCMTSSPKLRVITEADLKSYSPTNPSRGWQGKCQCCGRYRRNTLDTGKLSSKPSTSSPSSKSCANANPKGHTALESSAKKRPWYAKWRRLVCRMLIKLPAGPTTVYVAQAATFGLRQHLRKAIKSKLGKTCTSSKRLTLREASLTISSSAMRLKNCGNQAKGEPVQFICRCPFC